MERRGMTIVYTGNGKGKTTASIGQAMRAAGHGFDVCIIQFIKGTWQTGEAKTCMALPQIEFHSMGSGFTWRESPEATKQAAEAGWVLAEEKVLGGAFDLVVLDELTYVINYKLIAESTVLSLIRNRPRHVHLVISGREASPGLIATADIVTEMQEVKHPYAGGVKAQPGIEF